MACLFLVWRMWIKDSKVCILTLMLLVTGMMLVSGAAWSDTVVKPLWSTYHDELLAHGPGYGS